MMQMFSIPVFHKVLIEYPGLLPVHQTIYTREKNKNKIINQALYIVWSVLIEYLTYI